MSHDREPSQSPHSNIQDNNFSDLSSDWLSAQDQHFLAKIHDSNLSLGGDFHPGNDNSQPNSQNTQNCTSTFSEPQNQRHTNTNVHYLNSQLQKVNDMEQFMVRQEHFKNTISCDEFPTQSWHDYFEKIKTTEEDKIVIETETFYPVFTWRDSKKLQIGISTKHKNFLKLVTTEGKELKYKS